MFDNVFTDDAARIVAQCIAGGSSPAETAAALGKFARAKAGDPRYPSPFAYGAFQAGLRYMGGKMDDITIVVAYVVKADAATDSSPAKAGGQPASKL